MSLGAGDCEEYAVLKYFALLRSANVEACDCARHTHEPRPCRCCPYQYRLVLLDSRWLTLIRDFELSRAEPLFIARRSMESSMGPGVQPTECAVQTELVMTKVGALHVLHASVALG